MASLRNTYGPGLLLLLMAINTASCDKKNIPVVITSEITEISNEYAVAGGIVTDDGGDYVTDSGICWGTSENPTITDSKLSCCGGTGSYLVRIKPLVAGTRYYVRAYAINSAGTGYGDQVSFTTSQATMPGVMTTKISVISLSSAYSGGYLFDTGGGTIIGMGVCWSTDQNPTVSDFKTVDVFNPPPPYGYPQNISQSFTSKLTGLVPGTKYYVRAYVTTSAGSAYGEEINFSTIPDKPLVFNSSLSYGSVNDIDGNSYKTIQIGSQIWMAENLKTTKFNDGTSIPVVTGSEWYWQNTGSSAMCWYENDKATYKDLIGAYYNGYSVITKKLCPAGWHVPLKADWNLLFSTLGGSSVAGGKLKETNTDHWFSPNSGATNESGFTAIPAGYRLNGFQQIGPDASFWSGTGNYSYDHDYYFLSSAGSAIWLKSQSRTMGSSVRCVKD